MFIQYTCTSELSLFVCILLLTIQTFPKFGKYKELDNYYTFRFRFDMVLYWLGIFNCWVSQTKIEEKRSLWIHLGLILVCSIRNVRDRTVIFK